MDPINIKDSAVNVCTLNIRSLTIKEDSIKLKILFKLDADILHKDGDPNIRNATLGKQSRIDHILISPNLLHAVKKIEHVNYGRKVSDYSAVVMTLDWAETDKGQGVFCCGAETHKDKNYQEIIYSSFYKSVLDYIEDTSIQNDLRVRIDKILALTVK